MHSPKIGNRARISSPITCIQHFTGCSSHCSKGRHKVWKRSEPPPPAVFKFTDDVTDFIKNLKESIKTTTRLRKVSKFKICKFNI